MRIGFDARCLQTASAGGGIGRYARALAEGLPESGDELLVYVSARRPQPSLSLRSGARIDGLRRPPRGITLWDPVLWPPRMRRDELDVFHSPFYGVPARRPGQTRIVLTVHDVIPVLFPGAVTPRQRIVFERTYHSAAGADRVIVPSRRTRDDLISVSRAEPGRIEVIPLGLSAVFVDEAAGGAPIEARRSRGASARSQLTGGRPYLLNVGGFDPLKNLPALCDAFALLRQGGTAQRDLRLVLVGDTAGSRAEAVRGAAAGSGAGGAIVFPGRLDDAALVDAYFGAEAFLFPSRYEGFGLPPLEAMACGCPVVSSDGGSLGEVLEGAARMVPAGDDARFADDFASGIAEVLEDAALRARLIEAGRARAARLSWKAACAETVRVWREALAA